MLLEGWFEANEYGSNHRYCVHESIKMNSVNYCTLTIQVDTKNCRQKPSDAIVVRLKRVLSNEMKRELSERGSSSWGVF